jgi:hypothetical protein
MIQLVTNESDTFEAMQFTGSLTIHQRYWLERHLASSNLEAEFITIKLNTTRLHLKLIDVSAGCWIVKTSKNCVQVLSDKDFQKSFIKLNQFIIPNTEEIILSTTPPEKLNKLTLLLHADVLYTETLKQGYRFKPPSKHWTKPKLIAYINQIRTILT